MQAGKLRHLVTFSQPLDDSNDMTDNPGQWQPVLAVDADIRPVSIKEIEAAQGLLMQTDSVVECRWRFELLGMNNQWLIESDFFTEPCQVLTGRISASTARTGCHCPGLSVMSLLSSSG